MTDRAITARPTAAIAVVFLVAAVLGACGTQGAGSRTVSLQDERGFVPASLTIEAGGTVVFDNRTTRPHTVHAQRDGAAGATIESGRIVGHGSWAVQLDEPGTYVFHSPEGDDPRFTAVIDVVESAP